MRDLQALFEMPPRVRTYYVALQCRVAYDWLQYGKSLEWAKEHYTSHDVASVFRRYLTQMPVRPTIRTSRDLLTTTLQEPVIPHGMYHDVSGFYFLHDRRF
jgi:hypothetical protein